jgi:3-hydroxybutyryl-CoA dehydrogenase
MADVPFVFEAVSENVAVKQRVFQTLETVCGPETVFLSITSGIMAGKLVQGIAKKDRLLVAHAWNPPHLIPLVEVVATAYTDKNALARAVAFLEGLGRKVVLLKKDIPGFIGNRLMHAMYREALYLVEQGVATLEDIDATVLYSFGPRFSSVGLLEYYDSCGLDLQRSVQTYLLPELCNADAPQKLLTDAYDKGDYGPKTGKGLFDWNRKDAGDFRLRKSKPFFHFNHWDDGDAS